MNETAAIPDLEERRRALDPGASFIVQAPAGSGKTELLIQRTLVLLAQVQRPEEIAAVTFTKKAAAEMKQRVLAALNSARKEPRPEKEHKALTWDLARAVLVRNDKLGWELEASAARLRIQTIDALCASLTRQMPVLARFGAQPESVEDASGLYLEAARNTLALLEAGDDTAADAARLLTHLDNNIGTAEGLLADMLKKRDHWLRQHGRAADRVALEAALAALRANAVRRARALLIPGLAAPATDDAEAWKEFAATLLTKAGGWRKKHELHDSLEGNDALLDALTAVQSLPPAAYSGEQWQALGAIVRLLPRAVAELKLVFAAHGEADFVEIAQGALAALETDEGPTDLLLSLDYRIRHVLVDEFQDTSFTQYELLEKLTAGWEPGDGRTLFVVGDPMQSIYRFREAEVGLFLRARHEGIGGVALAPLTLSANFRSQADIVDWVNRAFAQVMPAQEDIGAGAVPYAPSEPVHPAEEGAVQVHAIFNGDKEGEAEQVAMLARGAQAADPEGTVAVLVRNRNHLAAIVPALKKAKIAFRAIKIEALGHRQAVQDLFALTRALSHPADRLAWLAVLRAPWCGLTLADLHAMANDLEDSKSETGSDSELQAYSNIKNDIRTLWELMHDATRLAALSADGRARLVRTRTVLEACLADRLRVSLREQVEGAWLALGGPACVDDPTDLDDAEAYLDYLEKEEEAGAIADFDAFEEGMASLWALPDVRAGEQAVQIMTIHNAKGLEFDTVILPGLGSGTGRDERELFIWLETPSGAGDSSLLIAPINPTGTDKDPIYETIRRLDKEKGGHEAGRLLYVAATRAKKHLHLLGNVNLAEGKEGVEMKPPGRNSLLEKLWPAVEADFEQAAAMSPATAGQEESFGAREGEIDQALRRLPSGWMLPDAPPAAAWAAPEDSSRTEEQIEFSWVGETARHVGTVTHRWLQRIAEDEMQGWDRARVEKLRESIRSELAARGVEETELPAAAERVATALANSIEDERGRWLLGPQAEARNEYRITATVDGERRKLVIDRSFKDEKGKLWIVDYKTSGHEGTDLESFLDREQERYRSQLERYAEAHSGSDTSLGLYFPLLGGWRAW